MRNVVFALLAIAGVGYLALQVIDSQTVGENSREIVVQPSSSDRADLNDDRTVEPRTQLDFAATVRTGRPVEAEQKRDPLVQFERIRYDCLPGSQTACKSGIRFDHPYDAYTYEQLMQIHEVDAIAAYILGAKLFFDDSFSEHFDYQAAVNHFDRATMISGHPQPYLHMLEARNLDYGSRPPALLRDRRESYLWHMSGYYAGILDAADLPRWVSDVRDKVSGDAGIRMIEEWNETAMEWAQYTTERRIHFTGESY
ncbi:MAG: hypothetical protein QNJ11_19045 [Woeseiaceae bacterium]|nr:hypothetical protein [Woeseiaceae bacterium]